jgi:hypothetical protein
MFGRKRKYDSIGSRVDAGVALLDKEQPDWWRRCDMFWLSIASGRNCVLGQTFGSYGHGQDVLELTRADCVNYGFQAQRGIYSGIDAEYAALTIEWGQRIRQRQRERVLV